MKNLEFTGTILHVYRVAVNLDTYTRRSFKSSFCMEGYLDTISNRSHRVFYSKMRISNYRFAIETGRFRKIPRDERRCLFCKKTTIYFYIVPCMNNIENNYMVAWTS